MSDFEFLKLFVKSKEGILEIENLQRITKLDDDDLNHILSRLTKDKLIRIDTLYVDNNHLDRYKITNEGNVRYNEILKIKIKDRNLNIRSWVGVFISIIAVIISLFNLLKN